MYCLEFLQPGLKQAGNAHSLGLGTFCIGSAPGADIVVSGLEPRHARLELTDSGAWVEAIEEGAPVRVDGKAVSGRSEVRVPARFQFGVVEASLRRSKEEEARTLVLRKPAVDGAKHGVAGGGAREAGDQTMRILRSPEAAGARGGGEKSLERKVLPEVVLGRQAEGEATMAFDMQAHLVEVDSAAGVHLEYALKHELARGGMGRIFAAEDPLLGREVAVKVSSVHAEGGDAQFAREAMVLAELAHPNIVPVHAMGVNAQGFPFYSMKLVRGKTLQAVLKELREKNAETAARYGVERLLLIFRKVCDTVEFAHAKGFLHRDLKPENVIVGEFGEVLVMDWGLAQPLPGKTWPRGGRVETSGDESACSEGTPLYMSPEQAQGKRLDERSDIYALGAVLYSILTQRPPVHGSSLAEVLRKVRDGEVTPLSTRLKASKAEVQAPAFVGEMRTRIPDALRAVTLKAMAREPARRYQSVSELVLDLESYLNGFATKAENANWLRQLYLWGRRHQGVSVLLCLLVLAVGGFTAQLAASQKQALESARNAEANALRANANALEARNNALEAEENAKVARKNAREAELSSRQAEEARDRARRETARAQIALVEAGERDLNAEAMNRVLPTIPPDLRTQEWEYLNARAHGSFNIFRAKNDKPWRALAPHPVDASILLCIQSDGVVERLNLLTGDSQTIASVQIAGALFHHSRFALSPDGLRFAVYKNVPSNSAPAGLKDYQIEIYTLSQSAEPLVIKGQRKGTFSPFDLQFSPGGEFLLGVPVNDRQDDVFMLDANSGAVLWKRSGDGPCAADFIAGGRVVVYSQVNGMVTLVARSGMPVAPKGEGQAELEVKKTKTALPVGDFGRVGFTADPEIFFSFQGDFCRKVNAQDKRFLFSVPIKNGSRGELAHLKGEDTFATIAPITERSGVLQIWDGTGGVGVLLTSVPLQVDSQRKVRTPWGGFKHPISKEIVVSMGNQLHVWKESPDLRTVSKSHPNALGFACAPGVFVKRQVVSGGTYRFELRDLAGAAKQPVAEKIIEHGLGPSTLVELELSVPRGGHKVMAHLGRNSGRPLLIAYETSEDGQITEDLHVAISESFALSFSPSGRRACDLRKIFDVTSEALASSLDRKGIVGEYAINRQFSPLFTWVGEDRVAEVCEALEAGVNDFAKAQRTLRMWDARDGRVRSTQAAIEASALDASPDGAHVVEAGTDMRVRIRNGLTLEVEQQFRLHDDAIASVAWHPTRQLLATTSKDHTLKIFDLSTEKVLVTLFCRYAEGTRLLWSPDGSSLMVFAPLHPCVYTPKF